MKEKVTLYVRKWGIDMFLGEYEHTLDRKGRVIVPAKFREDLGTCCIITRGSDGGLNVYTQAQWDCIYEELMKLPATKKDVRIYVRSLTSKAHRCDFDSQGRILIPAKLIEIAKLEKECTIIGAGNHVEVWDSKRWADMDALQESKFEEIEEQLTEYVL